MAKAPVRHSMIAYLTEGTGKVAVKLRPFLTSQVKDGRTAREFAESYRVLREMGEIWNNVGKMLSDAEIHLGTVLIPQAFENEKIQTFTFDDGARVGIQERYFASIIPDQKPAAYAWLRKNGMEDLITETVNSSTLAAAGKHMLKEGKELPERFFTAFFKKITSLTKG